MLTPKQLELTNQLKAARGQRFVALLKQVYYSIVPELVAEALTLKKSTGKLSVNDVTDMAIAYNLQLKHCFDFLEEQTVLPTGTYQSLLDRGLKPNQVIKQRKILREGEH